MLEYIDTIYKILKIKQKNYLKTNNILTGTWNNQDFPILRGLCQKLFSRILKF